MLDRILLVLTSFIIAVAFNLAMAAQREPEKVRPIVDPKYGTAAEIMAREPGELIAILKDAGASDFARAKACQRLAIVGGKEAVPALAALLPNATLSHYARFALEPIPDPSVDESLRAALKKVKGKLLIGVINSVGRRRDGAALDALAKLRHSSEWDVAEAAAAAMARIRPSL